MSVVSVAGLQGFKSGSPVTAGWVSCSMVGRVRLVVPRLRRYRHRRRLASLLRTGSDRTSVG